MFLTAAALLPLQLCGCCGAVCLLFRWLVLCSALSCLAECYRCFQLAGWLMVVCRA